MSLVAACNIQVWGTTRHALPNGTDLSGLSQRDLTQIATALNTRSRKCLGFLTPEAVMSQKIKLLSTAVALQS